jgi:CMP-N-acetylneuraminic acid synthetase
VTQKQSNLLILIPARSGSKSIPNKNTILLSGEPLLSWTAKVAIDSDLSKNIVLSTDSDKIAQLGKELGLQVPFIRPKDLAQDRTLQLDVIKHAVVLLGENFNMKFDSIMLLQPTSPFRSRELIVKSYDYFCKYNADTLITISDVSKFAPSTKYLVEKSLLPDLFQLELLSEEKQKQKQKQGTLRQDFEQIWWRNGSIYIFNTATLINSNSLYGGKTIGMPTNSVESINIDTPEDLALAKIIALGLRNL